MYHVSTAFPFSFDLKDECPKPVYFAGEKPHSIVIAVSELYGYHQSIPVRGCNSLLSILRNQFPDGTVIKDRDMARRHDSPIIFKKYLEIGFSSELSREKALLKDFLVGNTLIKVHKTLSASKSMYRVRISNIESLQNPSKYREEILIHLERFGIVDSLHIHYTEDGNWLTGDGCAVMSMSYINSEAITRHSELQISTDRYPVIS